MSRLHAIRSYYTDKDGLVELDDDVLSIVRQVRELYEDRITIELDPVTGWFHFVGHENGTDYLIFSTDELDGRALERLARSDSHARGHEDPYDAVEREQDELQSQIDNSQRERLSDAVERLAWGMKRDGIETRLPLQLPLMRPKNARR